MSSVIGTAIATVTTIVSFAAIIAGGINHRIDDVNARIDDVNMNVNARIDDVNTRIGDLQNDIRELRSLVIDAIKGDEPPAN